MAQSEQFEWPVARYHFRVEIGDLGQISFQEVTGLEQETQVIEYRDGDSEFFWSKKQPGLIKYPNLVCKKGVYIDDDELAELFKELEEEKEYYNDSGREGFNITVELLDAEGEAVMTWTLEQAFPVKYTSPEMKSDANEVAIESMEFAYEHMVIEGG